MDKTQQNKNKIAFTIGFLLILLVALVTFFRPSLKNKGADNSSNPPSSAGGAVVNYPKISAEELLGKIKTKEKISLIDVRSNDDFQIEHVIDSLCFPLEELPTSDLGVPAENLIVILAQNAQQDSQAFQIMEKKGFQKISVLSGGINAWKIAKGQTITWGNISSFEDNSKIAYISPEDLKKRLDEKYPLYILDIRQAGKFSPHILDAANIPFDLLEKRRSEIPFNEEIIICGESELDEFQAGVKLYDMGILTGQILRGGFPAWQAKGFPVAQ